MDKSGKKKIGVSAAERALFRRAMADVTPLEPQAEESNSPPISEEAPVLKNPVASAENEPAQGAGRRPRVRPESALYIQNQRQEVAGLDARSNQRLRQGRITPDVRLDLHGLSRAQAQLRVHQAVIQAAAQGKRCLLVITGRGRFSPEGRSVLRDALPDWLNAPDLRPLILAVRQAAPHHGGAGAVYIYLHRGGSGA